MKRLYEFTCEIFHPSGGRAASFTGTSEIEIEPVPDGSFDIFGDRLAGWSRAYYSAAAGFISERAENPGRIVIELKSEYLDGGEAQDIPQGAGTFEGIRDEISRATAARPPRESPRQNARTSPRCGFRGVCRHQDPPRSLHFSSRS